MTSGAIAVKFSVDEFRAWKNKKVTLLGMSGVGKTYLSTLLCGHHWFHYSGDYRIGTRYLDEAILDNIKQQAMQIPFLRDLLRSDSIYIVNNITVDNLKPVSSFLGKLGNPEAGGLPLAEFKRRQELHHTAEIAAMRDVPETNADDDIRGEPVGHFVVLTGYRRDTREILIADPFKANPLVGSRYYAVNVQRLIGSILLGIMTYDANLLVIEPKSSPQ